MPKPQLEFFSPDEIRWIPVEGTPGLSERILSRDEATGDCTRLLKYVPGSDARHLGVLRHDFWEEVWIVEGNLHDVTLAKTWTQGMYACRPPGMPHGPYTSPAGCVTFEVRYVDRQSS
jgi:hypothetical protein